MKTLRELQHSPHAALELGKAAEHLVVADLILKGYRAFLTDQGLPYDVVADLDGRIIRIQVKACCFSKNINAKGRNPRIAYSWTTGGDVSSYKAGFRKLTHCPQGHEYTPENTYIMKRGFKVCRICSKLRYKNRPKGAA